MELWLKLQMKDFRNLTQLVELAPELSGSINDLELTKYVDTDMDLSMEAGFLFAHRNKEPKFT